MISKSGTKVILISLLLAVYGCSNGASDGPYQATGIRIGEVTDNAAIVWTRLTQNPERVGSEAPMPEVRYLDSKTGKLTKRRKGRPDLVPVVRFPENSAIDTFEGAAPGAPGEIRILYKTEEASDWKATDWQRADPQRDYTAQFKLNSLEADSKCRVRVEARSIAAKKGQVINGGFRTAPRADYTGRILFTVSTGQVYGGQDVVSGGYKIYAEMLKLDPSFFVHTGDILYYDKLAKTIELARWHWQRTYSLATNVEFHRRVGSYFIKDDHDTWRNDCWPSMESKFMGDFTFKQGQAVFLEQVVYG
ncbi:MAG: alkaline phosphatase D family protein [Planctomycetota bacterium]|jgi:alkaline phosphatase D